jgi:hypothetical protein
MLTFTSAAALRSGILTKKHKKTKRNATCFIT